MLRGACIRVLAGAARLPRPAASAGPAAAAAAAVRRPPGAGATLSARRSGRVAAGLGRSASSTASSSSSSSGFDSGGGGDMYGMPALYDEVFGYRDFEEEAAFVRAAYKRHCPGRPLGTLLELGCGPARHAVLLAAADTRVWALDASPAMLAYAQGLARAAGARVNFVEGDMSGFALPELESGLDAAICLLGTFAHMTTNDSAVACFSCVSRHLRPGGMLLLELAHPGDLFDGSLLIGDDGGEMWEVDSAAAGGKLLVEWGTAGDDFDPETQVLARTVSVCRLEDGEAGEELHASRVRQRAFTLQELDLLGRLAGLRLAGVYGDLSLKVGLTHEDAYRLVTCFVKE